MVRTLTLLVVFSVIVSVLPLGDASAESAVITVDPLSGIVGTTVTVRGTGFTGSLATIYYDKSVVANRVRISETGEFTATFGVPQSSKGAHQIRVVDNTQPKSMSAETSFRVLPSIWIQPNIARLGASIAVMGSGFSQYESGIKVTLNGEVVSVSTTADFVGNWAVVFPVFNVSKGEHLIGAFGDSTQIDEVATVTLVVGPVIKMAPEKGPVGTTVQINGFCFRPSEDGVTITFDGELILYNVVANPDGTWQVKIDIPASTPGIHEIGAYGTFTSPDRVPKLKFRVTPEIKVIPDSVKVGEKIGVSGTGFGAEQIIKLTIGEMKVGEVTSDASGSFESVFEIPQVEAGLNKLSAADGLGNLAQANLNLIATGELPSIPELLSLEVLSPREGSQFRIFPSVLAAVTGIAKNFVVLIPKVFSSSIIVDFDWSDVPGPNDVSYAFQIADTPEFSSLLVDKEGLTSSEYTLSEKEALSPGDYYWRVRVVDEAGNASQWTEAQKIQVSLMTTRTLVILVVSVLLIIGLIIFLFLFWRARRAYYL